MHKVEHDFRCVEAPVLHAWRSAAAGGVQFGKEAADVVLASQQTILGASIVLT